MKLLYGVARKVALPVLVQAVVGWILFIVGFALWHNDSALYEGLNIANDNIDRYEDTDAYPDHRASSDYVPYWIVAVTGPVLFINSFVHLIVGRWYTGVFTHFITAVYICLAGGVVYRDARILFDSGIQELLVGVAFEGYCNGVECVVTGNLNDVPDVILDTVVTNQLGLPTGELDVSFSDYITDKDLCLYVLIEWVGCTWSLLMMTIYVVMWPLFPNNSADTIE